MAELASHLLRSFRRTPFVCLVILLTVASGVAINTATLSLAWAMLHRPLPFPELDRLVQMQAVQVGRDHRVSSNRVAGESWLNHAEYRRAVTSFEHYGLYWAQSFTWAGRGEPRRLLGASINDEFFPALGLAPRLGRLPTEEEVNARAGVAVISYALWQREFAGQTSVLGRVLTLNDASYEVIGVLPPRAALPLLGDIWVPLDPVGMHTLRSYKAVSFVGRLKPGVSMDDAQLDLNAAAEAQAVAHPVQNRDWRPWLFSLVDQQLGGNERTAVTLQVAALLLLVMATFNMGALIYAQAAQRSQETAVRLALGASPARLVRLALTETLSLVVPGVIAGVASAWLAVPFLAELSPNPALDYFLRDLTVRPEVAGASAALALFLGGLAAFLPAHQHLNVNVAMSIRESTRGGGLSPRVLRLQRLLVQAQLGVTAILLTGAVFLGLSYHGLLTADQGFQTAQRYAVTFALNPTRYPNTPPERIHQLARELQDRIAAIPGFRSAAVSSNLPVGDNNWLSLFGVPPRDTEEAKFEGIPYTRVSEQYQEAMGLRLLAGRFFTSADHVSAQPVAIVTESLAKRLWPGRSAVGETLLRRRDSVESKLLIIGVIADIKIGGARATAAPFVLFPITQAFPAQAMTVIAHSSLGEAESVEAIKRAMWRSDPTLPVVSAGSLADRIDATAAIESFQTRVLAALGALAVLITLMGISGLVLRVVTAREVEFSVRQALGATPLAIVRLLLLEQLRLVLVGILAGLALTWAIARLVDLPLFGITANSPLPYALTFGTMVFLALVSLAWPVIRAARVKPAQMLRA
ncbi:MAG TPA: ABC transporter permease [Opitutaceae bacterium]|nr:ABC transporter permease [Opitutaceae bacterium]